MPRLLRTGEKQDRRSRLNANGEPRPPARVSILKTEERSPGLERFHSAFPGIAAQWHGLSGTPTEADSVFLYSGGAAPVFHRTSECPSVCEYFQIFRRAHRPRRLGNEHTVCKTPIQMNNEIAAAVQIRGAHAPDRSSPSSCGEPPTPESEPWTAPATFGELVQGFHRGRWLQIAAPVALRRQARASLASPDDPIPRSRRYPKLQRALQRLLCACPGAAIRLLVGGDPVPRGAGFGSSTADIGAALRAAAQLLELPNPDAAVIDAALATEPTSGSLLPGLALFDHRRGTIRESLGEPPPIVILGIRLPGAVDTLEFNRRLPARLPAGALRAWDRAFQLCIEGVVHGNPEQIGAAASASSELAHHLGCPPAPAGVARVARESRAVGVLCAHSGTLRGLLYPATEAPAAGEIADRLRILGVHSVPVRGQSSSLRVCSLALAAGGMRRVAANLPFTPDAAIVAASQEGATGSRSEADAAPPL